MCIISFHFQQHPRYKLIIAANRDELYERPTKEAHFWEDHNDLLAGRDLQAMGTWLGITKQGKFAALTNYRDLSDMDEHKRSRGNIVRNFLTNKRDARSYLEEIRTEKDEYNGFNIILGTVDDLYYYSNKEDKIRRIEAGTHSVSNHLLNTPWPKVMKAKQSLAAYVNHHEELDKEVIFSQLNDRTFAPDESLPNTGVGIELERQLSPIFIRTGNYGTRSSTVIFVTNDNHVYFYERIYNDGSFKMENTFQFTIQNK